MEIVKTSIEGLLVIKPKVFEDDRGYFMETYKESFKENHFPSINFIQDNESFSTYGVLRGLHFHEFLRHQLLRLPLYLDCQFLIPLLQGAQNP